MVNETRKEKSTAFAWGGVGVFSREWIFSTFVFTVPHNGRWLCPNFLNITQSREMSQSEKNPLKWQCQLIIYSLIFLFEVICFFLHRMRVDSKGWKEAFGSGGSIVEGV